MRGCGNPCHRLYLRLPLRHLHACHITHRLAAAPCRCVLVGIAPGASERPQLVKGFMQLYSVEQSRSQVGSRRGCLLCGCCHATCAHYCHGLRGIATFCRGCCHACHYQHFVVLPLMQPASCLQALEAHAAAFTQLQLGGKLVPVISFAQKTLGAGGAVVSKLHVIELGQPGQTSLKKSAELFFPPEFADDFPVSMQIRCGVHLPVACWSMLLRVPCDLRPPACCHMRNPRFMLRLQRQVRAGVRGDQAGPAVCVRPGDRHRGALLFMW